MSIGQNKIRTERLVNEQNHTLVTASKEREETLVNYHKEIQPLAVIIPRLKAELKAANNKANQEGRDIDVVEASEDNDIEASEVTHEEIDVLIIHDSLFKCISDRLANNEKIKTRKEFAPTLEGDRGCTKPPGRGLSSRRNEIALKM